MAFCSLRRGDATTVYTAGTFVLSLVLPCGED